MKRGAWWARAAVMGATALVACGGGGAGGAGGAGGGTSGVGGKQTTTASSSSHAAASSGSGVVKVGMECAQKGTRQECFTCCEVDFPKENTALITDLGDACACDVPDGGPPPPCATDVACKPECVTMSFDDACLSCINNNAIKIKPQPPCVVTGFAQCRAAATCSPLLACSDAYCTQST